MVDAWLYIVLLGLVLVVYAKFIPNREPGAKQTNMIKEIESTMEQFSADLEEENRQFLELVSEMKNDHQVLTAKLEGRIEALEQQNRTIGEQLTLLQSAEHSRKEQQVSIRQMEASSAQPGEPNVTHETSPNAQVQDKQAVSADAKGSEYGPMNIRERYASVFELYDQGKSTEYIAKKLEMNKGEVMLIVQLAKREDQARV